MKITLAAALCAGLLVMTALPATAAPITYHVAVNTSALAGIPSGPYALDFQLNGFGPNVNTATVSNFSFVGGAPNLNPGPTTFGLASGSLSSSVTLSDNGSAFNEFFQGFTPGTSLDFYVTLATSNVNSPTPDVFSFAILQGPAPGFPNIPTTGLGDSLLLISLNTSTLGLNNVTAARGVGAFASVQATASVVPEPASLLLLATGLAGAGARRWRQRSAAAR